MIKLVPISSVHASEYNPRKNDELRLNLTELSLRKLGFVLPIYIDTSGEILSGHQRHTVAQRMGFNQIPVEVVSMDDLEQRKILNLLFNRATNDMQKQDSCKSNKSKLLKLDFEAMTKDLPDIDPNSPESWPCITRSQRIDTTRLAQQNHRKFSTNMRTLAAALERKIGSQMPIVVDENLEVVNGIGRLQFAAETKKMFVRCTVIKPEQAEFARYMLNLLTMDFDIGEDYADMLRYNSYMRARNTRETDAEGRCALGDGFFKGIWPDAVGRSFFEFSPEHLAVWKKHYGTSVVDFGAGKLNNTRTLRNAGIHVAAFEPYFVASADKVHKDKSVEIANKFLDDVETGILYDSVFISSVYNSVPFMEDRKKIAVIAAALCYPKGKVVCWCQSDQSLQFTQMKKKTLDTENKQTFQLEYEPNTALGELSRRPKVQKGHTAQELYDIFNPVFSKVTRMEMIHKFWYVEAEGPIISESLGDALDFEFNLPYPDGSRMGLAPRAREVFLNRLKIVKAGKEG